MTNKMTNRKALAFVLENVADLPKDVREKLESMAASLDNKATAITRKPTAKQVENVQLRRRIMDFLSENPNLLVTCTDIGKKVKELGGMSNQRISALMRALVEEGAVTKVTEKGKSLFQFAKPAVVEEGEEGGE